MKLKGVSNTFHQQKFKPRSEEFGKLLFQMKNYQLFGTVQNLHWKKLGVVS